MNNTKYPTVAKDFDNSFRVLRGLPEDVWLYTRAPNLKLEEKRLEKGETPNPFIDQAGYKEYIDAREKLYKDQLAHDKAAAKM